MATNQITKVEQDLPIGMVLPEEKYKLAKDIAAKGATDAEFQLLVHMANKYRLDPLAKQIWCIKRSSSDPATIMTSRDGYLEIAHRSGQFDGMDSKVSERDAQGNPIVATCTVWRKDMSHPFTAEVLFKEYNQPNSPTWKKYPGAMLIKVAEVFCLKRAFSISGMVTQEEMEDLPALPNHVEEATDVKVVEAVTEEPKEKVTMELQDTFDEWITKAAEEVGKTEKFILDELKKTYNLEDANVVRTVIDKMKAKYGK
jgi:phage recombination protein Bet